MLWLSVTRLGDDKSKFCELQEKSLNKRIKAQIIVNYAPNFAQS